MPHSLIFMNISYVLFYLIFPHDKEEVREDIKDTDLYEDSFGIVVRFHQTRHHGEGDSVVVLWAVHLYRYALQLLRSNEGRQLPGVALQLGVPELVERGDVGQLPFCLHQ